MSLPPLPPSLKLIKPYLDRASELRDKDLMVSYHCGLFALQEAMKMRASLPKEDMGFIMALMDSLEKEKEGLADLEDAAIKVENFGQELFMRADDRDRSGSSDLRTGKAFLAAAHVLETCKQFGELPDDVSEKIKYAKVRFVEIAKATKEGRPPPPPRGTVPAPPSADEGMDSGDASSSMAPPVSDDNNLLFGLPPPPASTEADGGQLPSYLGLPPAAPTENDRFGPPPDGPPPMPPQPYAPPSRNPHAADYQLPPPPTPMPSQMPPPHTAHHTSPHMPQQVPSHMQRYVPSHTQPHPQHMQPLDPSRQLTGSIVIPASPPGFKPQRAQILEAARLCQSSMNNLQFQDSETAVHQLTQALMLLTQPQIAPAPQVPE